MDAYRPKKRIRLSFAGSDNRQIMIDFGGDAGLRGKDRFTFLSKPLIKKLAEYRELYRLARFAVRLFERARGEQFTESIVSKRLKAAAQEAGITKRIYPHLLRHSFATHLIEQGTDLKIVKELMGHNSIKTTEMYVHIADTFKSNIKSPLDDILEEDGL